MRNAKYFAVPILCVVFVETFLLLMPVPPKPKPIPNWYGPREYQGIDWDGKPRWVRLTQYCNLMLADVWMKEGTVERGYSLCLNVPAPPEPVELAEGTQDGNPLHHR